MSEHCLDHDGNAKCINEVSKNIALLQKDIEYLRRDQELILIRFGKHVEDAEKQGGYHDRIKIAEAAILTQEKDLATFRKYQLLYSAIGGIVGGLVGSKSPELIIGFFKHLGM